MHAAAMYIAMACCVVILKCRVDVFVIVVVVAVVLLDPQCYSTYYKNIQVFCVSLNIGMLDEKEFYIFL